MNHPSTLAITTNNTNLIKALDYFYQQMISSGTDAGCILQIIEDYPDHFLSHCYAASFYLFSQTPVGMAKASALLNKVKHQRLQCNEREQLTFEAMQAWLQRDFALALKYLAIITREYPQDLLAAKYAEWLFYLSGQKYHANDMLALFEAMLPHHKNQSHFYSSYAFALELSGQRQRAIEVAEKAIDLEPMTPWAHHALAHAYFLLGQFETGIQRLEALQACWSQFRGPTRCHNHWHLGLMYMAMRDEAKVNQQFKQVWGHMPDQVFEQIDTVAYLCRMELLGLAHSQSWQAIAEQIAPHADAPYVPFNSFHFIFACARAGEDELAQSIIRNAEAYAETLSGSAAFAWRHVGLPIIKATYAHAHQDYQRVVHLLSPILQDLPACGGSDAQIEIMQEIYCYALIQLGKIDQAKDFFDAALSFYQGSAVASYWLERG